ncbi:xanthine dehydrogenase accessory protein XdhC [Nioella sediminis]|jgi:xanthine dehydrogenase accessory factor|uniref:xanthine dehydrogenase accessory protein XdhC n=1 Tax=Nioella sediminis TaxID=1912092 RepID=UPI0008FCEDBE|nr:xanthine dehydrogenase accessory protein XdhC [Nioella sediminis]TBX15430.1 molybdenum cofactor sulfurylase [Roseovarius sp. JS7-11]
MSLDLNALRAAVAAHGRVARVVIAGCAGSVPRETGTAMLVWADGQSGTIGGGALEFQAVDRARQALTGADRFDKVPLGPGLGQCCGGAVQLLTEVWDDARLATVTGDAHARPLPGTTTEMPLKLAGQLRAARAGHRPVESALVQGWFVEPIRAAATPLWVWGAGHVGRAIVATLSPLPDFAITWIDSAPDRFPNEIPHGVTALPAPDMPAALRLAPPDAHHLILTYSHEIDLALCHNALTRGFRFCGLIGSATKWTRFRKRLQQLGHSDAQISRITCPIGDPSLGKHPQAIAVGVAASLIRDAARDGTIQNTDRNQRHHSGGE